MEKAVILGAGISGLACAFRLKQLGCPSLVLEARDQVGGAIATVRRNGFVFELGPQFPRFPAPLWRLVQALNLQGEFLTGNPAAKRYIFRHGMLHPAVFSPSALLATRLVSTASKFRMLGEAFRSTQPPVQEESLAAFAQRKFGQDVVDNLVDPVVSTVFFGDANKMGMESALPALVEWERQAGSVLRGALRARKRKAGQAASLQLTDSLPSLGSFRNGMATLTEALARNLPDAIRCNLQIVSVSPSRQSRPKSAGWQIGLASGDQMLAEHLIVALPAYEAARLLGAVSPELSQLLAAIEYAPMCVVSAAYNRAQVAHPLDGFGFMVPRLEKCETICTFWNSFLFPQHAPAGKVLLTSFAGREAHENSAASPNGTCVQSVLDENAKILGISGEPIDHEVRHTTRALPQYNVGHALRVARINELQSHMPNLHLAANYLKGRSLGDCVALADDVAQRVHSQCQPNDI
jgi:oxygen-dependent protoporphyrinogen oxidase